MEIQKWTKIKRAITAMVTILILSFLLREHFNGGVISHHLLNRKDLPAISNWWGALLIPMLSWFLLTRIEKRLKKTATPLSLSNSGIAKVCWRFITAITFGILISTAFTYNYKPFLDNVLYLLITVSFLIPIFYSEFILGFILGMTYTFGAIIPTIFIIVMGLIGVVTYKFIRPLFLKIITRLKNN